MNYHPNNDWRNRRNLLNRQHLGTMAPFGHTPYSIANYSTDTQLKKTEMKEHFGDDILLNKLHMISNPLQKNLADTIVTSQHSDVKKMQTKINKTEINMASKMENSSTADNSTFSGIASFISGVFNIISGSIFHRQTKSEMECFEKEFDVCSHTFNAWQSSNFEDLNKNSLSDDQFSSLNIDISNINHSDMINDCHNAAKQCEDKIGKVRLLLSNGVIPIPQKSNPRRPRRVYVEPSSVEDNFEDAYCPEDFNNLPVESYVNHISLCNIQNQEMHEIDAEKVKTEAPPVHKNREVTKNVDLIDITENKNEAFVIPEGTNENVSEPATVVLSCEEKLNKLKALLHEKKNKCRTLLSTSDSPLEQKIENNFNKRVKVHKDKSISTPKVKDKRFKNPHKLRTFKKADLKRNILEDMSFANEIDCDTSGTENSPSMDPILSTDICQIKHLNDKDYFDEISGRFHTSSATESDDSFQIVFTDSPKNRSRKVSECDSEDSFIVFEEPFDCYTSTDVFGDGVNYTDSEYSDSESDYSDSECPVVELPCKLSHNLSRTVSDLTDDSLYEDGYKFSESIHSDSEDEIDLSPKISCHETSKAVNSTSKVDNIKDIQACESGLLIDEAKKLQKRKNPPKKVQFSTQPPKVHVMRVWAFAARQARMGHWERHALDRDRFKRRIADVEMAVSWVLKPQHRSRIMFQRFMPWWNAQKRKEIEEKKLQEEANKLQEANLDDKVDNKSVDNVVINIASNDNINDLVVGIGNKKIKHYLDNKIQNVKNMESDENIPKKVSNGLSNEIGLEKSKNIDLNSDKGEKNIEAIKTQNCVTTKDNLIDSDDVLNKIIDTPCVNGLNEFNESRQKIGYDVSMKSDINEKRNEIFQIPKLIGNADSKLEFLKETNECNDKLPDTFVGCHIKSKLSGI